MTALDAALAAVPIVAIVRHDSTEDAARIAYAAARGGARVIEITFTVPDAAVLIARLVAELPDVVVGAGTVLTAAQLDAAADAGAAFLLSPVTDPAILARAVERGIPAIPGAFSPTEVALGARGGAYAVKLYPARTLGPGFVAAIRDVLPGVKLLPTGGIGADDVAAWLDAGATAVGIAGALGTAWRRGGAEDVQQTMRAAVAAATNRSTS